MKQLTLSFNESGPLSPYSELDRESAKHDLDDFFLSSATRVGHEDEEFLDPDSMNALSLILGGVGLNF